jgi:hypothetical protein
MKMKRLKISVLVVSLALFAVYAGAVSSSGKALQQQTDCEPSSDGQSSSAAGTGAPAPGGPVEQPSGAASSATIGDVPGNWSFRNHVIPVLTKLGCNSGACHGAAAGKNGFKLTLRGYDPETDYAVLTRQALGRRVSLLEPEKSLMLLKPTLTIPHGGGRRFEVGSLEYRVISEWIASGAPPPSDKDPLIERIQVTPASRMLKIGDEQQLAVKAFFSDGHNEDVTRWVKYSSSNDGVATVSDSGLVRMQGSGEAVISLWYLSRVASALLSVPFPGKVEPQVYARSPRQNFIDDLVLKKLEALHIAPSGPCSDAQFIRRAYLDAIGVLPAADEVKAFLAERSADKRSRLIDALLERPEYTDYWSYKWSDLLLVSSRKLGTKTLLSFNRWIRESVRENKPWDVFVRELITSSGNVQENGAVGYYIVHKNPIDRVENMTAAFMGVRITCARCHNHPLEKWTQKDYYALANLFARVELKTGANQSDTTVFTSPVGEINHPKLGRPLPPRPLDGEPLPLDSPVDRRAHFAAWLTSPDNPYFARIIVNRVWKNFMGRGLVEPADDMRATNPPSNDDLLRALEQDFIKHHFDLKYVMRTIMNSATYQRSSETNETDREDDRYYSHYIVRRLPAEVLLDALSQVTAAPTRFEGYAEGTRSLQLPDSRVDSYFLTVFGRPERLITSESERQQDATLTQTLHIINGATINEKLRAGGFLDRLIKGGASDGEVIEQLYLAALSRYPTADEKVKLGASIANEGPSGRRQVLEDVVWAVLTGREFMFNH